MKATYVNGIMYLSSEDYEFSVCMDLHDAVEICLSKGLVLYARGSYLPLNCLVVPYSGRYGVGYAIYVE